MDPVFLSRIQFATTIGFHYLFPPLTIGLGLLMVLMEGAYVVTKNRAYEAMAKFWTKIFALIFAIGVASGIVMEFQFGTNWSTYSRYVGDIFGAALAAEGIFAFFLESGFLAVLVFGWDRVSTGMHMFATVMVSLGSMFSAVWIVVANSWQQTPAGFTIATERLPNGDLVEVARLANFFDAVLNHSSVLRLSHVLVGCMLAGAFLVLSVSAWYLIRRRHQDFARRSIAFAMPFALFWALLALFSGHLQGENVAEHQPAKLAAMEGLYETTTGADLYLFGLPNDAEQRVDYGVAIPGGLSYLAHWDWNAEVIGLDQFAPENRPPVHLPFISFHVMVGMGMLIILLTLLGTLLLFRGVLYRQKWLLWVFVFAIALPMASNQLGWITAEVGRQPWVVYPSGFETGADGLLTPVDGLRTADAASPSVSGGEVLTSIIASSLIYLMLFLVWIYVMDSKIRKGPESPEALEAAARQRKSGFLTAAAELLDPAAGHSMTEASRNDAKPSNGGGER